MNVEYVSANPTGRCISAIAAGAVVGDALAAVMAKAGFDVTKEYYINDAGGQVQALAWAAYWRYLQAIGSPITAEEFDAATPTGLQYRGEYLIPVGDALYEHFGATLATPDLGNRRSRPLVRPGARAGAIHDDGRKFGRIWRCSACGRRFSSSERALLESGAVDRAIAELDAKGLIYEGVLEPPKGKTPDDWEPRPQTLFRATEFGDDVDRPLRKSDGSNTYFANDIAYHADKIARGCGRADRRMGRRSRRLRVAHESGREGSVRWTRAARDRAVPDRACDARRPAGAHVEAGRHLRDAARLAGRGRARCCALHHAHAQIRRADGVRPRPGGGADAGESRSSTSNTPMPVAAACCAPRARAWVLLRSRPRLWRRRISQALDDPQELALIRRLIAWPRLVEGAAMAREPHRVAFFLYDLAGEFHMLWNKGRDDSTLRFLQAGDEAGTRARLALVAATAIVIRSGLYVLGVTPAEEMR